MEQWKFWVLPIMPDHQELETRIFVNGMARFGRPGPTSQSGPRCGPKYSGQTKLKRTFQFDFSLNFPEILA